MFNTTKTKIYNGPQEKECEKLRETKQSEEMVICAGEVSYIMTFNVTGRRDKKYIISTLSLKTAGQDRNASERFEFLKGKNFLYDPKKKVIMEYRDY